MSATTAQLPGGGGHGMVVVGRSGSTLSWNYRYVIPNGGSSEATYAPYFSGRQSIPAITVDPAKDVTLVQVPVSAGNPDGGIMMIFWSSAGGLRQMMLAPGATSWSAAAAIVTNGAPGVLASFSSGDVGAVAHDGLVYLAAVRTSTVFGTNRTLDLFTLPSGATQASTWQYFGTVPSNQSPNTLRPNQAVDLELAFGPEPTGNMDEEFFVFYTTSDNKVVQVRTSDSFNSWSEASYMGQVENERGFSAPAVVYDARLVVGLASGLRAFRQTHYLCVRPSYCDDGGYWPSHPSDMSCGSPLGLTYCESASLTGRAPSYIQYSPFATGLHPTEFCDYDDWEHISWSMCEMLAQQMTSASTPTLSGSVPYNTPIRCRNRPVYAEPSPLGCGGGASTALPGSNDRALHPEFYSLPDESTCNE